MKFITFMVRGSKMAYRGDVMQLLARLLIGIPHGLLYVLVALGAPVWAHCRRRAQLGRMLRKTRGLEPVPPAIE